MDNQFKFCNAYEKRDYTRFFKNRASQKLYIALLIISFILNLKGFASLLLLDFLSFNMEQALRNFELRNYRLYEKAETPYEKLMECRCQGKAEEVEES